MDFKEKRYRNVFNEMGIEQEQIEKRLTEIKEYFFYGGDDERVYYPVGADMAYIMDTGNHDVRTEGMSYGMMICVQLDMQEEFERLWKWAKTYMWLTDGVNEGYFAWSCAIDGSKNADGPAPDGEEFFAMSLFFAAHRWKKPEYEKEARKILRACIHKGDGTRGGEPMWNRENHQILFVPGVDFTDPSYHLPHFYELFALWADEEDREFWKEAAKASRKYLVKACHPVTGFSAEYAEFDGTPMKRKLAWSDDRHDWFFSDSYRTVANIGIDYEWFGIDEGQIQAVVNIQNFLRQDLRNGSFYIYETDGRKVNSEALHPIAIPATVAQATLAIVDLSENNEWVEYFWNQPMRRGRWRYYDNCLYFFAYLALSGNYRIWE